MANIKPASLRTGKTGKQEIETRQLTEDSLKGKSLSNKVPSRLTDNGKAIYKHLLKSFPKDFLCETDMYSLEILCNAIDMLQISQADIRERGLLLDDDTENPSVKTYDKFFKVFNTMAGKLGMSPVDRSKLAVLMVNQQKEEEDPLLKALSK